MLFSICIPAYNRPEKLMELLQSIDAQNLRIEIVICEDNSPKQLGIRKVAEDFKKNSSYDVKYFENKINLGFDGNLRNLIDKAKGDFVIFMGDDDLFVPGMLDQYLNFLQKHKNKKYVLRTYKTIHADGKEEMFKYLPESSDLIAGEETTAWLFKRSVSLAGFTISPKAARKFSTTLLDGTLLYQVYLMAQICLKNNTVFCDIPFCYARQSFRDDKPMFGNADAEKQKFQPGKVSIENSVNFVKSYFEVTRYLDKQNSCNLTELVLVDLSKYSYPILSIQRKNGINAFSKYAKILETEVGLNRKFHFHLYKWALLILGEKICDRIILFIKSLVGHTPRF